MRKAKDIVESIYIEKAKKDSNSKDLANTLNVLSKTVFGDVNRFIFELLQNADDATTGPTESIDVEFKLLEKYLIFSHNGAHFSEADVVGISSVGSRASKKDENIEKTGYKGIGFKSVFGSADYVHIISNEFSFRFDKNYKEWDDPSNYPWQVIPIWTENPEEEVVFELDYTRVNTIIEIGNRDAIRGEIEKVFDDPQVILFLRNVTTIRFLDHDAPIVHIAKDSSEKGIVKLYNDSNLVSSWITKEFDLHIDHDLSKRLGHLSDTECPQKLKNANSSKLMFAAQVNSQEILQIKNAAVYSYLPTKANKGFPFLINGDFLTNAARTELMSNVWNEFLFSEIATKLFEWFEEMQSTAYEFEVLKLLKGKYSTPITLLEAAYNKALETSAMSSCFCQNMATTFCYR